MIRNLASSVGIVALSLVCSSTTPAQSTPAELQTALKDKPLFLRGMWAERKLTFAADGTLTQTYTQAPFTESGVNVRSVKQKKDRIEISCERVGLTFDAKGLMKRIALNGLKIEVIAPPGSDLTQAREHIFANDLSELYPQLPSYWRPYVKQHLLISDPQTPANPNAAKPPATVISQAPKHIGATVKPPVVISQVDPAFSPAARAEHFSGFVTIYLWVNEDGAPSHFQIAKPAGLGLDEQALAAVAQYKFRPATQDGKPVKVDLYIDVNFQMF